MNCTQLTEFKSQQYVMWRQPLAHKDNNKVHKREPLDTLTDLSLKEDKLSNIFILENKTNL